MNLPMKIELEVPDSKVSYVMELLENIPFIKILKTEIPVKPKMDTTDYLLSTPTNEQRLSKALERSKQGISEQHHLLEE
jgi:hypothetical protein